MLHFDIDWQDLLRIGEELQASDKQIKFALSRAPHRGQFAQTLIKRFAESAWFASGNGPAQAVTLHQAESNAGI